MNIVKLYLTQTIYVETPNTPLQRNQSIIVWDNVKAYQICLHHVIKQNAAAITMPSRPKTSMTLSRFCIRQQKVP